jgi:hypothetical protein
LDIFLGTSALEAGIHSLLVVIALVETPMRACRNQAMYTLRIHMPGSQHSLLSHRNLTGRTCKRRVTQTVSPKRSTQDTTPRTDMFIELYT